nr:MAG: hypothetical protein B6I27_01665 [Erwiniaceae bacterium 4572_131]
MSEETLRQWFEKTIWALFPRYGDIDLTFEVFRKIIQENKNNKTDQVVTKELLLDKFSEYISYKDAKAKQNVDYKEKQKVSLFVWLSDSMWKQDFADKGQHNPLRDEYLYGINY